MLSYQHSYHAGNLADVHKHSLLAILLASLQRKNKPYVYLDTHAARGWYDLRADSANKTAEYTEGIDLLWSRADWPDELLLYRDALASRNTGSRLTYYSGSPAIAANAMRAGDAAMLMEWHPQEFAALKSAMGAQPQITLHCRDGREGLPALLPHNIRRGVVLLDPSYEEKQDYDNMALCVAAAHRRWAQGIYVVWYPILAAGRHQHLLRRFKQLQLGDVWVSEVGFSAPDEATWQGLKGSGMLVLNPPWQLEEKWQRAEQWLSASLPRWLEARNSWLTPDR